MRRLYLILTAIVLLSACRKEDPVIMPTSTKIEGATAYNGGFYLLNEGNMGSNKCTLDWYDGTATTYWKNIFPYRNPKVTMELGDVGNDLKIFDGKLWAVINCSNLVEVMDAETAVHIAQIPIPNCRYAASDGRYVYVSSYAGEILSGPGDRLGYVARIDTKSLTVKDICEVGYQPEEIVILGKRLYVANSGGYNAPDYDHTVSVIDLDSFTVVKTIDVAPNLHRMCEISGRIWVSSRGNYADIASAIYVIDPDGDTAPARLDVRCGGFAASADRVYAYGTEGGKAVYSVLDASDGSLITDSFITDGTASQIRTPYGIAVNPDTGDILIMDATDYVTPGKLFCYSKEGKLLWKTTTGDIPSSIAFL